MPEREMIRESVDLAKDDLMISGNRELSSMNIQKGVRSSLLMGTREKKSWG